MADQKKKLFPILLTPQALTHENHMLKNGHTDAAAEETVGEEKILVHSGTVCVRGHDLQGTTPPNAAKAVVLRQTQVPDPLPDNPDDLPASLKTHLKEGRVGTWNDENGTPYNFRFHRQDDGLNRDAGLCKDGHSPEKRKDNYLCLWLRFGTTWQAYEPMQFAVVAKPTNECGQSIGSSAGAKKA